jgi:hypothetical protein
VGHSAEITGSGSITGSFEYKDPDGNVITFYGWTFPVMLDGQAGLWTVWIDSDTDEGAAASAALQELETDGSTELGGIASNDGDYGDYGDYGDFGDLGDYGDFGDFGDDGGDGALAGGGDIGGSV